MELKLYYVAGDAFVAGITLGETRYALRWHQARLKQPIADFLE